MASDRKLDQISGSCCVKRPFPSLGNAGKMFFHRFAVVPLDRTGQRLTGPTSSRRAVLLRMSGVNARSALCSSKPQRVSWVDALLHERTDEIARRGAGRVVERLSLGAYRLHRAAAALQKRFPCGYGLFFAFKAEKSIRKFPIRVVSAADGKKRMYGKTERTGFLRGRERPPGQKVRRCNDIFACLKGKKTAVRDKPR